MIEIICQYPHQIVMGLASLIGAGVYATFSLLKHKKEQGKKFKVDVKKLVDTGWQSILAGVAAGTAIGCGYVGILTAMATGIGIDKLTNKLNIKKVNFLNLIQWIGSGLTKVDKPKSKSKKK